jgi:hypothetical protein
VVVEPGQDLGPVGLIGQGFTEVVVGDIGLPGFVGQVGFEPDE